MAQGLRPWLVSVLVSVFLFSLGCGQNSVAYDGDATPPEEVPAAQTPSKKETPAAPTPSTPAPSSSAPPAPPSGPPPSREPLPSLPPPPDMPPAPPIGDANEAAIEAARTSGKAVPVEMSGIDVIKLPSLVGGQFTTIRPEVGAYVMRNGGRCTGTLISPNVVISAAHCSKWENWDVPGTYEGGAFEITSPNGFVTRHYIEAVVSYGSPEAPASEDIALLRLTYSIPADLAQPAKLATAYPSGGAATIFGYGCNDRSYQENNFASGYKQMRTIALGNVKVVCPGDSGGPTMDAGGDVFRVTSGYATARFGGSIGQTISDWIPAWVPFVGWKTSDLFGDVVMYRDSIRLWIDYWAQFARPMPAEAG